MKNKIYLAGKPSTLTPITSLNWPRTGLEFSLSFGAGPPPVINNSFRAFAFVLRSVRFMLLYFSFNTFAVRIYRIKNIYKKAFWCENSEFDKNTHYVRWRRCIELLCHFFAVTASVFLFSKIFFFSNTIATSFSSSLLEKFTDRCFDCDIFLKNNENNE